MCKDSAMADADDTGSMAGALQFAIDQYLWGRAALQFAGISIAEHEVLAKRLGPGAAAEVLLLIIARQCGTDQCRWQRARDVGILGKGSAGLPRRPCRDVTTTLRPHRRIFAA